MIVVVDERATVTEGYTSWFGREGISACGLQPGEFEGWVSAATEQRPERAEELRTWAARRTRRERSAFELRVGHRDVLALPPA